MAYIEPTATPFPVSNTHSNPITDQAQMTVPPSTPPTATATLPTIVDTPIITRNGKFRSFNVQQKNDRKWLVGKLTSKIRGHGLFSSSSSEERSAYILQQRDELLEARSKLVGTTRQHYPRSHNEQLEVDWILGKFAYEIEHGMSKGSMRDDKRSLKEKEKHLCAGNDGGNEGGKRVGLRDKKRRDYAESDDEEYKAYDGGEDYENLGKHQRASVKEEVIKREEFEQEALRMGIGNDGDKVPSTDEDLYTVMSLCLRLEASPKLATKPYWGFNARMEMVLINPRGVTPDATEEATVGTKRKGDCAGWDGSFKRNRVQ